MEKRVLIPLMIVLTLSFVVADLNDSQKYICDKAYGYIQTHGQNLSFILELKNDTGLLNESIENLSVYIENWGRGCSKISNKTLSQKRLCDKVFYFISDTRYQYNDSFIDYFFSFKNESPSLAKTYLENYDSFCYYTGLSYRLPGIPTTGNIILNQDILSKDCFVDPENTFFNLSFPPQNYERGLNLGRSKSCLGYSKYIFNFDKDEAGNNIFSGIKIWWIFSIGIFFFLRAIFGLNKKVNTINDELFSGKIISD